MKKIAMTVCFLLVAFSMSSQELTSKLGPPYYWGGIIPTPQKVKYMENFLELADVKKGKVNCVLVLPDNPAPAVGAAAEMLAENFVKLGLKPEVMTNSAARKSGKTVILLGESQTVKKPEGYELRITPNGVQCLGVDPRGTYYAAVSLRQLMRIKDGKLQARCAEITDYPSVLLRTAGSSSAYSPQTLRWAGNYKINTLSIDYYGNAPWNRKNPPPAVTKNLRAAREKGFFDISSFINPWCTIRSCKGAERINIAKEKEVELLYQHFRQLAAAGAKSFMLCADDFCRFIDRKCVPSYPEEEQKFGTLEASHIYLANKIFHRLKKEFPKVDFYFCPPYYSISHIANSGDPAAARRYLAAIGKEMNQEIGIIMCGPGVSSLEINADHLAAMRQLLSGRTPFIWDNTSAHYFGGRICGTDRVQGGYFKPFTTKYHPELLSRIIPFCSNLNAGPPAALLPIMLISANNLLWNPNAYHAEISLRQALMSYAGPDAADPLIKMESCIQELIRAENASSTSSVTIKKELFREDFEKKSSIGQFYNNHELAKKITDDIAPSGTTFVRTSTKVKQYILRSSEKAFKLPLSEVADTGWFLFNLRVSRPGTPIRIILNCNQSKGIFLDQYITPRDTSWHRYALPLAGFKSVGNPEYISAYSIYNNRNYEEPVTFEVDNVIIGIGEESRLDTTGQLLAKLEQATVEAEKHILNSTVLGGTRAVFDKYRANYVRMRNNMSGPYTALKTEQPPTEELWVKTPKTSLFLDYRNDKKKITDTYAQIRYSPTHLYIRYYCVVPPNQPNKPTPDYGRDSLSESDGVELFLDPEATRQKYFHLGVNTIGSRLDSNFNGRSLNRNWNPDWNAKVTKDKGFWSVVLEIPFQSLGVKAPVSGQAWGGNFCRSNIPAGEYGAWKCPYGGFHNPKMFGVLKFE